MAVLNSDQQRVLNACTQSDSHIFCTGEGGVGKSLLLSNIVETLRADTQHKDKTVAVTASTGLAALDVSGTTLHGFAGIQVVEDNIQEMIKRARRGDSYANWVDTDVLIIDEISMISATLFDNLSLVSQDLRGSKEPFGGIRLIMFGDFLQLPPVSKGKNRVSRVFESASWTSMSVECFLLRKIMRQSDTVFKNVLSSLRTGTCSDGSEAYMKNLSRNLRYNDNIEPVKLFPLRASVDKYNDQKLGLISSVHHVYQSIDYGDRNILKQCIAPRSVTLKTGAQVMITRNLSPAIVNGSLGTVTGFERRGNSNIMHPVVVVAAGDGQHTTVTIDTCSWESIAPGGKKMLAKRVQIPVILAWATTIHKSQGQTISRLSVDLKGVFECGQTYVALSRAVDSSNLQVENFTKGKVKADPESVKFYERLTSAANEADALRGTVINRLPRAKIFVGFAED